MKKILLLSDTHGKLDDFIFKQVEVCDEIWHAGDFGGQGLDEKLLSFGKPLRGVWGNIDGQQIRKAFPEIAVFNVEGLKVLMIHIGGYPGRYPATLKSLLLREKPGMFICGHSHILKVIFDKTHNLLHINPGAAGTEGFHKVRTLVRFKIKGGKPFELEIVEKDRSIV